MLGHSIVSQHFMEPEGSIPNSQKLSTCSYPEPDQSSPHHPIPIIHYLHTKIFFSVTKIKKGSNMKRRRFEFSDLPNGPHEGYILARYPPFNCNSVPSHLVRCHRKSHTVGRQTFGSRFCELPYHGPTHHKGSSMECLIHPIKFLYC
jgi:hypothetical protein